MVDKIYAMSSFLQFRTIYNKNVKFAESIDVMRRANIDFASERKQIDTYEQLYEHVKDCVTSETSKGKAALCLSGGIDSAICAKFMPEGSTAYTFKCIVPGKDVTDETQKARQFCDINKLKHSIVEIYWSDYESRSSELFRYMNVPFHSIDIQIYKAALQAKKDGFDTLIFGQGADLIYGGFDKLLSKEWSMGDFIERYSCVMPYKVLNDFIVITEPYMKFNKDGYIDLHNFLDDHLFWEDIHSYHNACAAAGIKFVGAYMNTFHKPLDLKRVRTGEGKYLVRELFKHIYPNSEIPIKTPMPRATDEWLENWSGPTRPEFLQNCHINMTGDQKYLVWILEKFLEEYI